MDVINELLHPGLPDGIFLNNDENKNISGIYALPKKPDAKLTKFWDGIKIISKKKTSQIYNI